MNPARALAWAFLISTMALGAIGCGAAESGSDGAVAANGAESSEEASDLAGINAPRGLISSGPAAMPGYVFFTPLLSGTTYLIDQAGQVVHTWESEYAPSGWVYLLDNGNLFRGGREPDVEFAGGGQGGRIEEFTWDGELVWDFRFATDEHLLHHDVAVLPNGNVLAIAWENKTVDEARRAGRRAELTPEAGIWPDMIVEFEPQRPDGARIVWEWHMWDHTIQEVDESLGTYGVVSEHPELIDINGDREPAEMSEEELEQLKALGYVPDDATLEDAGADFMHTNAIAYDPYLDQIVVSVPRFNEVWVIDHSTTTEEAASHTGGRWGKGGDLLYRWGNPRNYGAGDESDQRLFAQHDVRWVEEGLPGAGHLTVFSNDMSGPEGDYSTVYEIDPPIDDQGNYLGTETWAVEPLWIYNAPDKVSFHSSFISGAHRLGNGNTLITSGAQGRFFEVTEQDEIVWEYWTPFSGRIQMPDGAQPHPVGEFTYAVFRATKLIPGHPALSGRDLTPLSPQPAPVAPPPPPDGR